MIAPLLLAGALLVPTAHPVAAPGPPPEHTCDRLSVCLIIDCDREAVCLLPGLPNLPLPGLP